MDLDYLQSPWIGIILDLYDRIRFILCFRDIHERYLEIFICFLLSICYNFMRNIWMYIYYLFILNSCINKSDVSIV